jgi:gliding motility-associated-like protein
MKSKILVCSLLFSLICSAQGEANFWYFGNGAGLDFNSGNPIGTFGSLTTKEGSATISNPSGNLLFYTDGVTVFNRNHAVMLNGNGLFGDPSSTQSATIILLPGSATLYYVFTIDEEAGPNGLSYSIVDISLDGGLGAVTIKNNPIYAPTCEKITVVKHANGEDYWILTHKWKSNTFDARILTSAGLNPSPVLSNVGTVVTGTSVNNAETIGYMKISPDGTKVAVCHTYMGIAELFDFDNTTGTLSNPQTILTLSSGKENVYGVEFSPSGKALYIAILDAKSIVQFDLSASDIPASKQTVYNSTLAPAGMQLGPDGKIYIAVGEFLTYKIGVINNPNLLGKGCDVIIDAIALNGGTSRLGITSFDVSLFFKPSIFLKNSCSGDTAAFELISNQKIKSVIWDFGDGTSPQIMNNTSKVTHQYTTTGVFAVKASGIQGAYKNFTDVIDNITIYQRAAATKPSDNLICDTNNNGLFRFDLTLNNSQILNGQDPAKYLIRYFENAAKYANDTAILNAKQYSLPGAYQSETIYAEVSNIENPNCKALTTFDIDVFDSPASAPVTVSKISKCDDTSAGTNADGFVLFDLTQRTSELLSTQVPKPPTVYKVEYYNDVALANLIANPLAYQNTSKTQTIHAKIFNQENASCYVQASFDIEVLDVPIASNTKLDICDLDGDGFSAFDLTKANSLITPNYAALKIDYFESVADAQAGTNPIVNFTGYSNKTIFTDNQVYAKVSTSSCFSIAQITLNANVTPMEPTVVTSVIYCKDQPAVPLTAIGSNLLWYSAPTGGTGSPTAPIPNPAIVGETMYYVSQNNICESPRAAVKIIVGAIPTAILPEETSICIDTATNTLIAPYTIQTGLSEMDYNFEWYTINKGLPALIIGETQNQYSTSVSGTFGVVITDAVTKCTSELIATNVIESHPPLSMEVLIPDYFTENITLIIDVAPSGTYEYKIDDGAFQTNNTFYNLGSGNQTIITVRDMNNCGEIYKEVVLINYPKFFTPNNDGFNDTWNITDLQDQKQSSIQIFDRYGKLIKQIKPSGQGWDGTYNGTSLPSADYWFFVDYLDKNNNSRQFKSHFALKR